MLIYMFLYVYLKNYEFICIFQNCNSLWRGLQSMAHALYLLNENWKGKLTISTGTGECRRLHLFPYTCLPQSTVYGQFHRSCNRTPVSFSPEWYTQRNQCGDEWKPTYKYDQQCKLIHYYNSLSLTNVFRMFC